MTEPLGLSIGATNLVAARVGRPPVLRRSILTIFTDRAPEVGVPSDPPSPGVLLSGFVERVGDPIPVIAADGSVHRGEQVLAAALDAMAQSVDGGSPIAIAVPAHWGPGDVGALRSSLRTVESLAPNGIPATLIPDSTAALAALQAAPGLPERGIVALVDLGGSGCSITLADAGANLNAIGQTVRYPQFSGDRIDQALLDHVLAGITDANGAAGTAASESLTKLRDECRAAKELLSAEPAAVVPVGLPQARSEVRVTRPELEQLISPALAGLLDTIDTVLQQNGVPPADVSAVATVGGGAAIPLVTQQLSQRLRAQVVTTPQAQLNVAAGAALVANQSVGADAPTAMGSAAWAARVAGLAASESAADGAASATFRALAWSQDDASAPDPLPYTGDDYMSPTPMSPTSPTSPAGYPDQGTTAARAPVPFTPDDDLDRFGDAPLPWYKRPPVLFGAAATAALLAAGGLAVTLTSSFGDSTTVTETRTPQLPPPVTTVTVGPDGVATTTVSQPPATSTTSAETTTETTTTETTTTTTQPTTTTTQPTTTTAATTTRTTTTQPTTTEPTTTQAPTTTAEPEPTTTVAPDEGA